MIDEAAHEVRSEDEPTASTDAPDMGSEYAEQVDPDDDARDRRRAALQVLTELSEEIGYR